MKCPAHIFVNAACNVLAVLQLVSENPENSKTNVFGFVLIIIILFPPVKESFMCTGNSSWSALGNRPPHLIWGPGWKYG